MTAAFWDKRSKKYDDNIKKHDAIYEKTIRSTKSLLTNSDVVLDFACASGEISLDIAPHVQRVHGIDESVKMIELANQTAAQSHAENRLSASDPTLAPCQFRCSKSSVVASFSTSSSL